MKKNLSKRLCSVFLTFVMFVSICIPSAAVESVSVASTIPDLRTELTKPEDLADTLNPEDTVTVIVELAGESTLDVDEFCEVFQDSSLGFAIDATVTAFRNNLVNEQSDIQTQISAMIPKAEFRYHYTNLINGFAARVHYKDIDHIRSLDGVLDVYMTQSYEYDIGWDDKTTPLEYISLDEYYNTYGGDGIELAEGVYSENSTFSDYGSVSQMNMQTAWDAGYTGAGKVVGIFDSSLRYTHNLFNYMNPSIVAGKPDNYKTKEDLTKIVNANEKTLNLFDSGWGSWFHQREETGFSKEVQDQIKKGDFHYSEKVPFAVDYMDGDLEVWDGAASSHGTHVAGIAVGNPGPKDTSKPVGIDNVSGVLGAAYDSQLMFFKVFSEHDRFAQESDESVFAALDDAVTLGVNAFNLSLGIPNGFTTMNTYAQAGYQKAYNRAAAAGISIAVSAGNDARESHSGSLVNGYTTLLPNSSKIGFSGSLFAPMAVASAQGTGYQYKTEYSETTLTVADSAGKSIYTASLVDNNATMIGKTLNGNYEIVDCGLGSVEEILTATGSAQLDGALAGKVALIKRGTGTFPQMGEHAYSAGAVAVVMGNNADTSSALIISQIYPGLPTFGMFPSNDYNAIRTHMSAETLKASFVSQILTTPVVVTNPDLGPSGFTSWGVTEALRLKPDIMAPGGGILSAGGANDQQLVTKSGTSMASPNMEGGFILVQQYIDDNLNTFGVTTGTQEYTNLINQLVASTATVYQPYSSVVNSTRKNLYFSPRRQGAGMANIGDAVESKVVLRNDTVHNAETGESPRTKVDLFDNLKDTFTFSFTLDNYNTAVRSFEVLSCLQTDATTLSAKRNIIVAPNSFGNDIDAIEDAVMTLKAVNGGAVITNNSSNINRYSAGSSAAIVSVPANSSIEVTIEVKLNATTMEKYDKIYPNGMFLDGYVFFDSDHEDVNIPFVGFRGDWNQAPIFDQVTAYEDISNLALTDINYPLFHTTSLNTVVTSKDGEAQEVVLGANQYTNNIWPGYHASDIENVSMIRGYFENLRHENSIDVKNAAISNRDNAFNFVYANLAMLRNAKAVCVVIEDNNGKTVKTLGPEFEYFKTLATDRNMTHQSAATHGTKYNRNMSWDGTDAKGNPVDDGQYTYKVIAMTEYEFLNTPDCIPSTNTWGEFSVEDGASTPPPSGNPPPTQRLEVGVLPSAHADKDNHSMTGMTAAYKNIVLKAMLASDSVQFIEMDIKVDNKNPTIKATLDGLKLSVQITDEGSGLQSSVLYYDRKKIGTIELLDGYKADLAYDLSTLDDNESFDLEIFEPSKLTIQAVDYALNMGSYSFEETGEEWAESLYISGFPDKTFKPNGMITRAQTVAILYNLYGEKTKNLSALDTFEDINANHWGAEAMAWAIEAGYIKGDRDMPIVRPNDTITRGELTSVIAQINTKYDFTSALTKPSKIPSFTDISTHWAKDFIKLFSEYGVISGYGDGTFKPGQPIKRSETVVMIATLIGRNKEYTPNQTFSDLDKGHWAYDYIMNAANGLKK